MSLFSRLQKKRTSDAVASVPVAADIQDGQTSGDASCVWYAEFADGTAADLYFTHDEGRETVAQINPDAVLLIPYGADDAVRVAFEREPVGGADSV